MSGDNSFSEEVVLFVAKDFKKTLPSILSGYLKEKEIICLVSVNRGYVELSKSLQKEKIPENKVFIIDSTPGDRIERDNVTYVAAPNAFTELSIAAKNALKHGIGAVVFDSLSTLLRYDRKTVVKFMRDLINFTRKENKQLFITLLEADKDHEISKTIQSMVDLVNYSGKGNPMMKEDANQLMQELFGPKAQALLKGLRETKKPGSMLQEFETILGQLVGPENAKKQLAQLYRKYGLANQ